MSLVELLCGLAILSVLGASMTGVLVVSANSYNRGVSEVGVQQEAQLVANQVSDLLIDATADVTFTGGVLTVVQGGNTFTVTHNSADKTLYYSDGSDSQLMAEGVETFDVDVADYQENGYARLSIRFTNSDKEYPAVFTITARNKDSENPQVMAAILLPSQIILEPFQEYTFSPATAGLTNPGLNWSLTGNTDAGTVIDSSGHITIGGGEEANFVRVFVESQETDDAGNPKANKMVNVYVRRVTSVNVTGVLASGTEGASGATYNLSAAVNGNNLAQALGAGAEIGAYVDPYGVVWSVTEGPAVVNSVGVVTLTGDIPEGGRVVVRAQATHPDGANKTGGDYGDVYGEWIKEKTLNPLIPGGGWMRQTNQAQATVSGDIDIIKQNIALQIEAATGVRPTLHHEVEINYREYPSGTPSGWLPNIYGDANNSMSVNLRPLMTGALDYRKGYEMSLRIVVKDQDGNMVWPEATTPQSSYMITNVVQPVGVTFDSDVLGLNGAVMNSQDTAPTIDMNRDGGYELLRYKEVIGIDTEGTNFTNAMNFIVEKQGDDGSWNSVSGGYEIQNANGTLRFTPRTSNFEGSYRVKVEVRNQPNNVLNDDGTLTQNGNMDYILHNEETGNNIFYFNAELSAEDR